MILDRDVNYLGEFGGIGKGPGQFNGVHAVAVGPSGRIFALDRSGGRINVFTTTADPAKVEFVDALPGFSAAARHHRQRRQPLGHRPRSRCASSSSTSRATQLYTWMVPPDLPDGYLEVHTFSVDSSRQSVRRRQPVRPHAEVRAEARRRSGAAHPRAVEVVR